MALDVSSPWGVSRSCVSSSIFETHFIRCDMQKECREKLVILLYCSMNLTQATPGELAFALPHAVNLAGMGKTLRDKQLGTIFMIPDTSEYSAK